HTKMERLKVVGLTLMSTVLLGAVTAIPAHAVALPEFTVETGFKSATGSGVFETNFIEKISCKKSTGKGTPKNKQDGTYSVDFEGCTGPFGESCESLGDSVGVILTTGEYHLVRLKAKEAGIWFLTNETHIDCLQKAELLVLVKGDFLGKITPVLTKTTAFEVEVKKASATTQAITEYENDAGTKVKAGGLLTSVDGKAFNKSSEESKENKLTLEKEGEIINTN